VNITTVNGTQIDAKNIDSQSHLPKKSAFIRVHPRPNPHLNLYLNVLLSLALLLLSACLPTPIPTPMPTPMTSDSATVIADESRDIVFPTGWTAINLQSEDVEQRLAELQNQSAGQDRGDAWERAVSQLQAAMDHDSTMLIALYEGTEVGDSAMLPNLTAMLLPRNGLSLQVYLDESERVLGETDGVVMEKAEFDDGLLANGAPAATLHYRLENSEPQVGGYQVLFFDENAEQVMVMTFAAAVADFETMLPAFREVVRIIE